ncbi:MAG: cell division protein SepF [Propionibacteriaceae bacterium]|nr:cell division protein SepF [Propionibacteriaceae bacterium]
MPTVFRKAANWLGLVDDERYDYQPPQDEQPQAEAESEEYIPDDEQSEPVELPPANVTPLRPDIQTQPEHFRRPSSDIAAVYPVTITARSYEDAQRIGENYRSGVPVMMNLTAMPTSEAKRVLDFNTGLVFAMGGRLEKVAPKMFLLTPAGVEVNQTERDRVVAGLVRAA